MEKAKSLDCDAIIFDLEDAVAANAKAEARAQVAAAVNGGGYGYRELIVRINGLDTPWGSDDLAMAAKLPVSGIALSQGGVEGSGCRDHCSHGYERR